MGLESFRRIRNGLDFLLLDLPPSAGQPQQALVHQVEMSGVVIVTTPQDLSLLDAGRSLRLFQQAGVPLLGIVENMSYFVCPNCQERHEIFQHSQRWRPPALEQAPLLGRVPMTAAISQGIDRAEPLVHDRPESVQAQAFREIAERLQSRLQEPAE